MISFCFSPHLRTFAAQKHCCGLPPVPLKGDGRKVRAAQGAPLLKVEAVGDGWLGKKKTTAPALLREKRVGQGQG